MCDVNDIDHHTQVIIDRFEELWADRFFEPFKDFEPGEYNAIRAMAKIMFVRGISMGIDAGDIISNEQ